MEQVNIGWSRFRITFTLHPELTDARLAVLVAELRAILARDPGRDPLEMDPILLAGGQVWASPNWDAGGELVWTIYKPEDR